MKHACIAGLWVASALAGCNHAPPPTAQAEGSSTYTFLPPVQSPPPAKPKGPAGDGPREPTEMMVLASAIEPLAKPAYPKAALGREKLPVQVGVHITIDATGGVAGVRMSLAAMTTPTPYMDEFRNAVEEALSQWRFRPAELRVLKPTTDTTGAPAWTLDRREKTDCEFDVSFTFQTTGEVLSHVK